MLFAAIFAIWVGILMVAQWTITLLRNKVAGPESGISGRGRVEMAFHYIAESATAILLIIAGIGLLIEASWGQTLFFISIGMLIYTVVNSPGYFAQQKQWPLVIMFTILLVLAIISLVLVV